MNYQEFIESKIALAPQSGFVLARDKINPLLKDHQKDAVQWSVKGGRRAIFMAFGLGKTFIQLEALRNIIDEEGGKALIVLDLGVRQEFKRDAKKLGIRVQYVGNDAEVTACNCDIMITNYERVRDGKINVNFFIAVSLDEASILRSFGSKTYQTFLPLFCQVKYRYVATATPSPNRYKELIHYAGFLGIMDTGQALTRFFQRDSTKANNLTLYPHKEKEFYMWMASWACFVNKPSDLGYSDDGYSLPPLELHHHVIDIDHLAAEADKDGQMRMFRDTARSVIDASHEKQLTLEARMKKYKEIVDAEPDKHFILWHDLEPEREMLKKIIPDAVEVYGKLDLESREQRVLDFSDGKIKYLATKPCISGSGCNFQYHCSRAIIGVGFKFNDFIQAIHRIYRFLQSETVHIHLVYADSQMHELEVLMEKWEKHKKLQVEMSGLIKQYGLNSGLIAGKMKRGLGVKRQEVKGEHFIAVNNDNVEEMPRIADNSIGLIHTSIPFANHYEYTPNYNDFGHNENNERFFEQMDYLTPELYRVLMPGRVAAIHVKDRVLFGNVTGYGMPSLDPFHALTLFHFMKHGFIFFGMITIETDVVRENNQTYRLGWTEQCKDGSKMGVGCPEYLLLFRKLPSDTSKAYADDKIGKTKDQYSLGKWQIDARAKWNSSGNRFLTRDEIANLNIESISANYRDMMHQTIYDYQQHVDTAEALDAMGKLPKKFEALQVPSRDENLVWSDICRMRTLNGTQAQKCREKHICPLQFDIVDRTIDRWSNPGDWVLDPFGGLMTVPYRAIKFNRKGYGIELNPVSWNDGVEHCQGMEREVNQPDMFELLGIGELVIREKELFSF